MRIIKKRQTTTFDSIIQHSAHGNSTRFILYIVIQHMEILNIFIDEDKL